MHELARYLHVFVPMLWLGAVLAISFLEAPIKFRAPGVTLALGLGIGRMVFRALNTAEAVFAAVLVIFCFVLSPGVAGWVLLLCVVAVLAIQILVIRPPLTKRSNRILAGEDAPRSNVHYFYVGFEIVKVGLLIALAIVLAHRIIA